MLNHTWKSVGVNPKPLDNVLAKLVISNTGDDPRNRMTSIGGPRETEVAAVKIKVNSNTVQGSQ